MEVLMYGENGIFGSPLVTSLGTLFYFLVFGTFFSNCGGGGVLIDGGMKLSDKTVGGPAKAAVISSGLLFTISLIYMFRRGLLHELSQVLYFAEIYPYTL